MWIKALIDRENNQIISCRHIKEICLTTGCIKFYSCLLQKLKKTMWQNIIFILKLHMPYGIVMQSPSKIKASYFETDDSVMHVNLVNSSCPEYSWLDLVRVLYQEIILLMKVYTLTPNFFLFHDMWIGICAVRASVDIGPYSFVIRPRPETVFQVFAARVKMLYMHE